MFNSSVSLIAEKKVTVRQQDGHNFNIVFPSFIILKNSTANKRVTYTATLNVMRVAISSYCVVGIS
jgi:hypothetical protein